MDVKLKMTLWYTLLAVAAALAIGLSLLVQGRSATDRYYAETLSAAARMAVDEVTYENGELRVDDDLKDIPDVHISLHTVNGTLIYGRSRFSLPFLAGRTRTETLQGVRWYVLDTLLPFDWRADVWMRCAKRADAEGNVFAPVARLALVLLPLLIVLTGVGGYLIACRAFRPVQKMARTADDILSGGDLNKRVAIRPGARDELSELAHTLDRMLERLDAAFRHERQFTSDAAHELRTPLSALRLLCEEALLKPDCAEKDALLVEITERTGALSALTEKLLTLSRMDAGRMEPHMESVNLGALLFGVAQELEPVAGEAGVALETELEPDVLCRCDPSLLTRLAVNLLSNAIRYGHRGGHARLALQRDGTGALLTVSDDGMGLSAEELPHIWERFWRADASRQTEGTGLGLSIVKWIIDSHGGRAEAESAPGVGTIIRVWLP